jgi:hypothetical protein
MSEKTPQEKACSDLVDLVKEEMKAEAALLITVIDGQVTFVMNVEKPNRDNVPVLLENLAGKLRKELNIGNESSHTKH